MLSNLQTAGLGVGYRVHQGYLIG